MTMINVDEIHLTPGKHKSIKDGACVMELVSYIAGGAWSDHPPCVSRVLGAFLRAVNDALPDEPRQRLRAYAPLVIGTAGDAAADERRSWLATDWLVRTYAPAWLDLAGLTSHAEALRGLTTIDESAAVETAMPILFAAEAAAEAATRAAAWTAAWTAAEAAAWTAARTAAEAATKAAARTAAWTAAARTAAGAAARTAAWTAAEDAARAALTPTVQALQDSAFTLLDQMIAA